MTATMARVAHRLEVADRCAGGHRHIHRYAPSCSCGGWWGIACRTMDLAGEQHRAHVAAEAHHGHPPVARPVTPASRLPAALQPTIYRETT